MTREQYERSTKLRESDNLLNYLESVLTHPFPHLRIVIPKLSLLFAPKLSLFCPGDGAGIRFYDLDEKTREELRKAIKDVVERRRKEIEEEFKEL